MKTLLPAIVGLVIGLISAFYVFAITFNYPWAEAVDDVFISIVVSGMIVGLLFKEQGFKSCLIGFLSPWGFVLGLWLLGTIEAIPEGGKVFEQLGIILLTASALVVIPMGTAYIKTRITKRHEDSSTTKS